MVTTLVQRCNAVLQSSLQTVTCNITLKHASKVIHMLYCRDSTEEHLEIWKKTSGKKENQEESIETAEHNKNRHFRNEKGAGTRQD